MVGCLLDVVILQKRCSACCWLDSNRPKGLQHVAGWCNIVLSLRE